MESILSRLLTPDSTVIQEATKELRQAFKDPNVVPTLCTIISSSPDPKVRQYSAVLLRKRLNKHMFWWKIPIEIRRSIKEVAIQALVNEQEKFVKNCIAQLIGTIIKHEFPQESWPELMNFIQDLTSSCNNNEKELGFYTLSIITEIASDQFISHAESLGNLYVDTLNSLTDLASPISYFTLLTMTHMTVAVNGNQPLVNIYHKLMPKVIAVILAQAYSRPDRALECMNLLEDLAEDAVTVLTPHVKPLVELCLQLAVDKAVGEDVQIKALCFIGTIVRAKKKTIVKHKLVVPILEVLFRLMCTPAASEQQEQYFAEDTDTNTPMTCANQALDVLALHLPPELLIPPLLQSIEPSMQSGDKCLKKASYLAMAVLAEGCADYIRKKHLKMFLQYVCEGIVDQTISVRNAALFTLGQFSEHLQPEISTYANELLPVLFEFLGSLRGCETEPPGGVDRMFYALESFCENLDKALLPFLPALMERLLPLLSAPHAVHLRELAISALSAAANAAHEAMLPYFPIIMEALKQYLTQTQTDETMCLQIQSVDTLGVLARTVGVATFQPLSLESAQLGLTLLHSSVDPDLRKSVYGLFASIASIMKQDMATLLPAMVEPMITSVKSEEGIVFHCPDDDNDYAFPAYEELNDSTEEEDIDHESEASQDEVSSYTVDNAYVEEKEQACLALKELALYCGPVFMPYLEQCFDEVFKIINFPQEDIRRAAIESLVQFCINFSKIETPEGTKALHAALNVVISKCSEIVQTDLEREVVIVALDAFAELLKEIGAPVLVGEGHCEAIINCAKDVMTHRTECQDQDVDVDEGEAEQDELLIESAGEIVPNLGNAMTHQVFAQHFHILLPLFLSRLNKGTSDAQRSFSVGMIAESMRGLGPCVAQFSAQLIPILVQLSRDECDEVRNNAIFAIGEMALHGKETMYPCYTEILQALSGAVAKESHAGTLDNICGALARLIITNTNGVPINQVLPVFIQYLPLREDFDENKWVFQCLTHLYQLGTKVLVEHLVSVVKACAFVLFRNEPDKETKDVIVKLVQMCYRDFPNDCAVAAGQLTQEEAAVLQEICAS